MKLESKMENLFKIEAIVRINVRFTLKICFMSGHKSKKQAQMYFLVSWTLLFSQTAIPLQCSCETTYIFRY